MSEDKAKCLEDVELEKISGGNDENDDDPMQDMICENGHVFQVKLSALSLYENSDDNRIICPFCGSDNVRRAN